MRQSIRKSILMGSILKILGAGVLIPVVLLFPGMSILLKEFMKREKIEKSSRNFKMMIKKAKNRKLIKIVQKDGEEFLEITKLGRKELLKYNIDELKIEIPKVWDKKWRMVIFDIPEKFREGRVALSKKLKEIGFFPLQKSVFVYPYECDNEIDFIREFFDVKKYVILLNVLTLGEYYDLILKQHFDLF
jgi:DNA-binding transcriptional regulator PaaX